jgi:hypothetical protein
MFLSEVLAGSREKLDYKCDAYEAGALPDFLLRVTAKRISLLHGGPRVGVEQIPHLSLQKDVWIWDT